MNKFEIYGYIVIAVLSLALVVTFVHISKNGVYYGRRIPRPPEYLRPKKKQGLPQYPSPPPPPLKLCKHGFSIKDVVDLTIDPRCKSCGKKLSELKKINSSRT